MNNLDNAFVEKNKVITSSITLFSGLHGLQYEKSGHIVLGANNFLFIKKISWDYSFDYVPRGTAESQSAVQPSGGLEPISISLRTAPTSEDDKGIEIFRAKGVFGLDYTFDKYHLISNYLQVVIENPNCLYCADLVVKVTLKGIWVSVPSFGNPSLAEVERWAQSNLGITTKLVSDGNYRPNAPVQSTEESFQKAKESLQNAIDAKNTWLSQNTIPAYESQEDCLVSSEPIFIFPATPDAYPIFVEESEKQENKVSWTRYVERQQERRRERYQSDKPKSKGFFKFLFGLSLLLNSPLLFELLPLLVVLYVC